MPPLATPTSLSLSMATLVTSLRLTRCTVPVAWSNTRTAAVVIAEDEDSPDPAGTVPVTSASRTCGLDKLDIRSVA